jgi:hypothetical protein
MRTALLLVASAFVLGVAAAASAGTVQGRGMMMATVTPVSNEDLLEKKVGLSARRVMPLKEALDLLAAKVGAKVVVPEGLEDRLNATVKGIDVKSVALREILIVLLEPYGLTFESKDHGREILIKELPKPEPQQP